ncbi:hypothetical protein A9Q86_15610 [Flavobacteriales bacterium 33_180_T64]|nr:hypothetical protein A9Q86_15610 [Flavobacteriales bacterium 33_180_T64]
MKYTRYIILITLVTFIQVFSQEKLNKEKSQVKIFNEGYFVSKITQKINLEPDTLNSITYFKNNKIRAESPYYVGSGQTILIVDVKTKEILTLTDHPYYGKTFSLAKRNSREDQKEKYEVVLGNKKRKILGYNCQQYIIKVNESTQFEIYSTKEFSTTYLNNNKTLRLELKVGFILYRKVTSEGQTQSISEVVKIVSEPVSDKKFSLTPPKEYMKIGE